MKDFDDDLLFRISLVSTWTVASSTQRCPPEIAMDFWNAVPPGPFLEAVAGKYGRGYYCQTALPRRRYSSGGLSVAKGLAAPKRAGRNAPDGNFYDP